MRHSSSPQHLSMLKVFSCQTIKEKPKYVIYVAASSLKEAKSFIKENSIEATYYDIFLDIDTTTEIEGLLYTGSVGFIPKLHHQ